MIPQEEKREPKVVMAVRVARLVKREYARLAKRETRIRGKRVTASSLAAEVLTNNAQSIANGNGAAQ